MNLVNLKAAHEKAYSMCEITISHATMASNNMGWVCYSYWNEEDCESYYAVTKFYTIDWLNFEFDCVKHSIGLAPAARYIIEQLTKI